MPGFSLKTVAIILNRYLWIRKVFNRQELAISELGIHNLLQ